MMKGGIWVTINESHYIMRFIKAALDIIFNACGNLLVYFISFQSKPIIGLIEFFLTFFSILMKFSNW